MNPITWLLVCFTIAASAIGGIVYLQVKGKVGKYTWSEKDTDLSGGCLASYLIAIPFLYIEYLAIHFADKNIISKLPVSAPPVLRPIILLAAIVVTGVILGMVDKYTLRQWGLWRWLNYWAVRSERHNRPRESTGKDGQ